MRLDKNHIYITTKHSLKCLGGIWSAKLTAWRFPKSTEALQSIQEAFPDIANTEAFQQIKNTLESQRNALKAIKQATPNSPTTDTRLRIYQQQDVNYLKSIPHAGLFNEPRTGKTPTMICTLKELQTVYNLIVCPASLQLNWKKEIEKWHSEADVFIYAGTPKKRSRQINDFKNAKRTAYLIVSKDTAKTNVYSFLELRIDALVIDEAHFLRNSETKQSEAIRTIGHKAVHRYALTGTPTVKHPVDIFGILKFLYPDKFKSYWQFAQRYFTVNKTHFGTEIGSPIPSRAKELKDFIDAVSTQRLRRDVMQWLPDKERHTHTCHMSTKQEKLYNSMLEDFYAAHGGTEVDTQNVLAQLMRLRQLCLDPQLLGFDAPSAKTDALLESIENNTYGTPVIIMSMFTSYLKLLEPQLKKLNKRIGTIYGDMNAKQKQQAAEDFQNGKIDVLLCNIISAGTGFTLDRGEVIIFTDLPYNPSDMQQAEDRITPTQKENVHNHFIVSMICENTVDEKLLRIIERKDNLTSFINQMKSVDQLKMLMV
jgi:SNF2 family DNA or RNA helicase